MHILLRKGISFLRIPFKEKIWFICIFILSGLIRVVLLCLPFRLIAPKLGLHYRNVQLASVVNSEQRMQAWRIGHITELASSYTPWQSKCLVQAVAARILLGWYNIPYVLHLGLHKPHGKEIDAMKAHAWLTTGAWVITGREGHRTFTIVSTFVAPSILDSVYTSDQNLHADK